MNDKQIVEYCKNIVLNNLKQYTDKAEVLAEIIELQDRSNIKANNKRYLQHFKGLKELFNKSIDILTKEENE